ncbi:hypothetical protein I4J22_11015 [Corynebacterium diphtheriae]|uniref:hypothetical protein n=1 Tax=Corynebacterium diphtheriae TaxID=1717 RepID=UPI0018CB8AD1|nr:hypothetical protein [Corynebacterium diphtheriae]MBG9228776.1 hypothetical protein [Corynebacterium diphtheriae bv. gravis]MBG9251478.1 hypothetical protein [Corynebacterium diphtheriae bv. mitis]MBG9255729.1 hypothetical protein [Corynebacterium diphtheriae bv. mitis]MBG9262488.1 hypothetical protein [Corynebacterium diphtheriae bv. mitis]MBG9269241.1 hypothetical protein [Corynebacterium diphtheriae bv. mitis]
MINQNNHVAPDTQQRTNTPTNKEQTHNNNNNKHNNHNTLTPHSARQKPSWVTRIHPDKKQNRQQLSPNNKNSLERR